METNRIRIRKDFKPLTTTCNIVTMTPNSPVTQTYNSESGEWEPDRVVGTGTTLRPVCFAAVNDGSFKKGIVNPSLTNIVWTANGKDITKEADWTGKFTIDQGGTDAKGSITIKKNILPSERVVLRFTGVITDTRLNTNVTFGAEETLSTHDNSEDEWSLQLNQSQVFVYNPIKDKLVQYVYATSHKLPIAWDGKTVLDQNSYPAAFTPSLFKGKSLYEDSITYKLYRLVNGERASLEGIADYVIRDGEYRKLGEFVFDMRLIEKEDFIIAAEVNKVEKASIQISLGRKYSSPDTSYLSDADIEASDKYTVNKLLVSYDGETIPYPDAVFGIDWFTSTAYASNVKHNLGDFVIIDLKKAYADSQPSVNSSWMEVWADIVQKPPMRAAIDKDGNTFVDRTLNQYIFS